jgi:hypothetical protein
MSLVRPQLIQQRTTRSFIQRQTRSRSLTSSPTMHFCSGVDTQKPPFLERNVTPAEVPPKAACPRPAEEGHLRKFTIHPSSRSSCLRAPYRPRLFQMIVRPISYQVMIMRRGQRSHRPDLCLEFLRSSISNVRVLEMVLPAAKAAMKMRECDCG